MKQTEFKNIVLPTDGSEYTGTAISQALRLAKSMNGRITALYVKEEDELGDEIAEGSTSIVEALCKKRGIPFEKRIEVGSPSKVIVELSDSHDLVVMGTLGKTGIRKVLLGSVALNVVNEARCPVIVVRNITAHDISDFRSDDVKEILVAINVSRSIDRIEDTALEFAKAVDGNITALYVKDGDEQAGKAAIDDFMKKGAAMGVDVKELILSGRPGKVINGVSRDYDLIIIGIGDSSITKAVIGRVASDVITNAVRPVMVIKRLEE